MNIVGVATGYVVTADSLSCAITLIKHYRTTVTKNYEILTVLEPVAPHGKAKGLLRKEKYGGGGALLLYDSYGLRRSRVFGAEIQDLMRVGYQDSRTGRKCKRMKNHLGY